MHMNNDNSTQCHFDVEELQTIADNFHRDGFVHVPAVLSGDLVEDLKKKTASRRAAAVDNARSLLAKGRAFLMMAIGVKPRALPTSSQEHRTTQTSCPW